MATRKLFRTAMFLVLAWVAVTPALLFARDVTAVLNGDASFYGFGHPSVNVVANDSDKWIFFAHGEDEYGRSSSDSKYAATVTTTIGKDEGAFRLDAGTETHTQFWPFPNSVGGLSKYSLTVDDSSPTVKYFNLVLFGGDDARATHEHTGYGGTAPLSEVIPFENIAFDGVDHDTFNDILVYRAHFTSHLLAEVGLETHAVLSQDYLIYNVEEGFWTITDSGEPEKKLFPLTSSGSPNVGVPEGLHAGFPFAGLQYGGHSLTTGQSTAPGENSPERLFLQVPRSDPVPAIWDVPASVFTFGSRNALSVEIPADAPPGEYHLGVFGSGERLTATPGTAVDLTTLVAGGMPSVYIEAPIASVGDPMPIVYGFGLSGSASGVDWTAVVPVPEPTAATLCIIGAVCFWLCRKAAKPANQPGARFRPTSQ
ncbi:MAG: hypothetical protein U0836_09250 [Pirellulales bacterium]